MKSDTTVIKTLTPKENLFGGKTKSVNAFNSTKTLTDCSWETSRESRESEQDRIAKLIAHTQLSLNENC